MRELLAPAGNMDAFKAAIANGCNAIYLGTHQIRVHLASIGHPLLHDKLYGKASKERMMLHATRLSFIHPFTNEIHTIECQPNF